MKRRIALLAAAAVLVASRVAPARPEQARAVDAAAVSSVVDLSSFPAQVRLDDAGDRAALVVQATLADGTTRDVTALAALTFADPGVATIDSSAVVAPLVDGRTTLRVAHGGRTLDVAVVVSGAGVARRVSFENDVLPVLTRAGCNTGSCHGTSRGKDGFHLSLFGYDPQGDHFRITRQQVGRRIDLAAPEESLLLLKATGAVRHTGGGRLEPDGRQHRALLAWLSAGAPADAPDLARVERLELRPERSVMPEAAGTQRLSVRAIYADGTDRDVTELTALTTSDASVAALDSHAAVVAGRRGEAWITARFGEMVVAAQVLVVPAASDVAFPSAAEEPEDHYVDRLVNDKLRRLRARPSALADDATWLRRVTLDVTGLLPAPGEVEAFLADGAPDRRARRVDALLERPAFVELWTMLWAERLLVRSSDKVSEKAALRYAAWLEAQLAAGIPLDRMVRDLLTATGGSFDSPAVNFFHAEEDTKKLAENVAQVFLGIRLQCAQCHNHPFDRWTQDDYYGFAAFFARIGRKPGGDPRERLLFDRGGGELNHPVTNAPAAPRFLGGPALGASKATRREDLARWLTAPENPWFARNVANMIWTHFLGVGIVHEPDDARVSNPPSNPALLDALAERLRATGYDFKALVRDICTSRTYQRSTAPAPGAAPAPGGDRDYARAHVRRLRAEVLLDAIAQVTGVPNDFKGLPRGGRAVEIADGATTNDFLTTFGRAARESVCACEVRVSPNLGQALHLLNGDTVNRKIKQGKLVARLLKETPDPAAVVRALYLRTLSRPPTEAELAAVLPLLESEPAPALEDLLWALLNSGEFLFNH